MVERDTHILGANVVENEGHHARLFARGSDQPQTGDREESRSRISQQFMLVGGDAFHSDLFYIVERRAQPHGIGDVAGPGLKARRRLLVSGLLEGDVHDHIAAAMPGRHGVEQVHLSVNNADSGRCEDLVSRKYVEVTVERLHIHPHMGDGLRAIDQDARAVAARHLYHLARWCDGSESVRYVAERYDP